MSSLALALALAFAAQASGSSAQRPLVAVVKSTALAPYASVVAGFASVVKAEVAEFDLQDDPARVEPVFSELKGRSPALVLALGPRAANAAKRALARTPLLFAMVPNYEKYGLEAQNVTGIALTRPAKAQLEALTAVAPKARRVAALFNPKYSKPVFESAAEAAKALGLELIAAKVEAPEDVPGALGALKGRVEAVWMLADRSVANAEAAEAIIRISLEEKLPLFALTESQVRDGALLSVSPDYGAVGQQAGRLANRIVLEKVHPGALEVALPEVLDVAFNLATARKIGQARELSLDILEYAAKHGYFVRAFE
jgi:putative ABC transport system substrate-binding protein